MSWELTKLNPLIVAHLYLDKKYKSKLNKGERFEIIFDESNLDEIYFRIVDKYGMAVNSIKYKNMFKNDITSHKGFYSNFLPSKVEYFKKRKINVNTYKHILKDYIINKTYDYKSSSGKKIDKISFGITANGTLHVNNSVIDDRLEEIFEKIGITLKKNKRNTHFIFEKNPKDIYTYLKLSGELDVS